MERGWTLAEVAEAFLLDLSPQERAIACTEVFKFVRWLGLSRQVKDIGPLDVASYSEQIPPLAVKPLKSFLTYIQKKGFTTLSLAAHLRVKKYSPKTAASWQISPLQSSLTPQGYAKLEAELLDLKKQLPEVVDEMQKAAADKDFSENAPLAAARERKAHLEGRIRELELTLNLAKIVRESQDKSKIKFGDTVVLCDLSSGQKCCYTLVDSKEANPAQGKISILSPLGKALLDKERGQTVEVNAPAGVFRYLIEDICDSNGSKTELTD